MKFNCRIEMAEVPVDAAQGLRQILPVNQRDPRLRPYRFLMWTAYLLAIALAIGAMVASIGKNLTGSRSPSKGALPTRAGARVCAEELDALNLELNQRAWRLGGEIGGGDAVARFNAWSWEWEQRLEDLGDRCRLDISAGAPGDFTGRDELAQARDAVLALHRAYRAQVNRFAVEQAELARTAATAIDHARQRATQQP
jgi:hypothetical protein